MKRKKLSELVEEFIAEQDVNALSRKSYEFALQRFVRWVVISRLVFWELRRKDIIDYKMYLLNEGKSVYTIDLYLTVVRKFYRWMELCGLYEDIAAGIRSPRKDRKFKKGYLSEQQVGNLLGSIDKTTELGMRDYCIILLMLSTGMRRVEVCRMRVGDIEVGEHNTVRVQRKGHVSKDTRLMLSDTVVAAINDYLCVRSDWTDDSALFVNCSRAYLGAPMRPEMVSRMIKQRLMAAGIDVKRISCHSLRHTAAILSLKEGVELFDVQQMLGHTDIKTTTIYLRAIEDETKIDNRAVKALDKMISERLFGGKMG